jgi:RNA polymerase sigma factor (sigma-70 family)
MKFDSLFAGLPTEVINPVRERFLIHRLDQSPKARESLALESMWEAVVFLRSCACAQISSEELFSLSWDALTRAVKNYRPRPQFRFFTYAKCYLRGNLKRALRMRLVVRNAVSCEPLDGFQDESEFLKVAVVPVTTCFNFSDPVANEGLGAMSKFTRKLPAADQQILKWKYLKHFSDSEIALKRGVTRQAISIANRRILKRLRWMVRLEEIRRGAQ